VLWWTVPKAKLKMRRNLLLTDLRVPLVGRAAAVVQRRLAASQKTWLWPSIGKTGHVMQRAVGVAVWSHMPYAETRPDWVRPRLPVTHWAPHDLRRTGRTMLSGMGCPERVAEALLGHLTPGIVGVYDRYQYDPERLEWLTKLSARLEQLAG
jgi:integrase